MSYALGQCLAELSWSRANPNPGDLDELARIRRVIDLLPQGASDDLVRTALWFCAGSEPAEQFDLGITLMTKGLDAYLSEQHPRPAVR